MECLRDFPFLLLKFPAFLEVLAAPAAAFITLLYIFLLVRGRRSNLLCACPISEAMLPLEKTSKPQELLVLQISNRNFIRLCLLEEKVTSLRLIISQDDDDEEEEEDSNIPCTPKN